MTMGRLIAIVGPDGSGKTTLAKATLDAFTGPTAYVHFRPPLRGPLLVAPPANPRVIPKTIEQEGNPLLGWGRLFYNLVAFWWGYMAVVRPALRAGALIVADRWCYGYIAQPKALRFYGPAWLARLLIPLFPQPALVVNLKASVAEIATRKQELTSSEIEAELSAWNRLSVRRLLVLESTEPPEVLARRVLAVST